ncbi:MAG TPA: hypothetical protein VE400_02705, partial [Mycobacterium sp.]|nr:hypothetical protein [Mycobacterium sp.]
MSRSRFSAYSVSEMVPVLGPALDVWPRRLRATASYTGGSGIVLVSNLVFDEVAGSWIAVGLGSMQCNNAPVEVWVVFTLQPQPGGTLTGET